jgi:hypothetical protein
MKIALARVGAGIRSAWPVAWRLLSAVILLLVAANLFLFTIGQFGAVERPSAGFAAEYPSRLGLATGTTGLIATLGFACIAIIGAVTWLGDFPKFWSNVQMVFESGTFYFFAGLALIIFARSGSDASEHPTITFILAMLGLAIMLFGTGSQATGALATLGAALPDVGGEKKRAAAGDQNADPEPPAGDAGKPTAPQPARGDWGPIKANAVVAGGAAVLTAIFAVGVIHFSDKIPTVFQDYQTYRRVLIRPCLAADKKACNKSDLAKSIDFPLNAYDVSAAGGHGDRLFLVSNPKDVVVMVQEKDVREIPRISVEFKSRLGSGLDSRYDPLVRADIHFSPDHSAIEKACDDGAACRAQLITSEATGRDNLVALDTFAIDFSSRGTPPIESVRTTWFGEIPIK